MYNEREGILFNVPTPLRYAQCKPASPSLPPPLTPGEGDKRE